MPWGTPRTVNERSDARSMAIRLIFVSEKRLGFGTHGASNIAQRFSDALVVWYREDMDVADAEARASASARELSWLQLRLDLQRRRGEPCVAIHRWTQAPGTVLPDIPAPTSVGAIPPGYVCPQLRLFSAFMYTDDPLFLTVGLERTKRALRVWRRLTDAVRLIMAIPEKRTLGSWGRWLGVNVISNLGLIVVPRDKMSRRGWEGVRGREGRERSERMGTARMSGAGVLFRAATAHSQHTRNSQLTPPSGPVPPPPRRARGRRRRAPGAAAGRTRGRAAGAGAPAWSCESGRRRAPCA